MHKTIKKNMKRKTSKKRGLKKRSTKKQVGGARSRPPTPQQKALAAKQRDANKALREKEKEKKKKEEGEIVREKIVPVSSYIPESKIVPVSSYIPGSKTVPSMKELINGPQSPSFLQRALGNKDKPSIFKSIPQFNLPGQVTNQASTLSAPGGGSSLKPVKSIRQLNPMKQETKELLQGGEFSSLPPKLVSNPPPPKPESRPPSKLASSPSSKPASMIPSFFRPSNPKPKPETNPVELEDRSLGAIRARQEEMERRTQSAVVLERKTERKPIVPAAGGRSSSMSPLIGSRALVGPKPETPQLVYLPPNQFTADDVENLLKQYGIKLGNNIPFTSQEVANLVALYTYGYLNGTEYLGYYQYLDGPDNPISLSKARIIQANLLKTAKEYKKKYDILEAAEKLKAKNSQKSALKKMTTIKVGPDDSRYKDELDNLHKFDEILQNKINGTNERTDRNPEGRADLTLDEQLELQEYYENPILQKLIDGGSYPALQAEAKFVQKESASLMKVQMTEDQKRKKIQDMIRKGQTQSLFGPSLTPAQKQEAIYVQKRLAAEKQQQALRVKQQAEFHKQVGLKVKQEEDAERVQQILANRQPKRTMRSPPLPSTSKFIFPSSEGSMSEDSLVKPLRRLSRETTGSGLQGDKLEETDEEEEETDEEEETTSQYSSDQIREAQEGAIDGIQTAAGLAVLAATAITGIGVIGLMAGGGKSKKRRVHIKHVKKRHTKRGHK